LIVTGSGRTRHDDLDAGDDGMGADAVFSVFGGKGEEIMINNAMFSSNRDDWETPLELFNQLDAIYHFDLDVCALPHNAKCDKYYTPDDDGLSKPWEGTCWMNPPYGRQIGRWMEKAYKSSLVGATVVCLVPSRTDTAWWHDYAMRASKITYIRGRIKFVGAKHGAPFPCAIVVFGQHINPAE
jgi:phage N-6-adenine-methyltransferase